MFEWLGHAKFLEAGHASEWISGIAGAGGALAGAFVSVLWTEYFNRRTRKRDDRRLTHTAAHSAYHKLNKIYSTSRTILRHYEDFVAQYQPSTGPKCLSLMGMLISDRSIWFSVEERKGILDASGKAIAKTSGLRLLNTLQDLDEGFNFLTACAIRYGIERQRFLDDMNPEEVTGTVGTSFSISPRQLVRANALDMEIDQIFPMSKDIAENALSAIRDLVYLPGKPLGKNFSVQLPMLNDETLNLRAVDAPVPKRWFQFWKSSHTI
jgi:hypothetical protein